MLPRISVFSLGGTIAMGSTAPGKGVSLSHSAEMLIAAVPGLAEIAEIEAQSFRLLPSPDITLDDLAALAREINHRLDDGVRGIVVTQGTDTLEESAFVIDRLVQNDAPVVFTGAMRNPTMPGPDGPANLFHAVIVALDQQARGIGTLVVMNDEIHAARYVKKLHTTSPAAFHSSPAGAIGWVIEKRARIVTRPGGRYPIALPAAPRAARVARLSVGLDEDGTLVELALQAGYHGIVVDVTGGGHVPKAMVEALGQAARRIPVVYASRTRHGDTMQATYDFPGAETDLLARGLIPAGWLDGIKSRLLLTLLLRAGAGEEEIRQAFESWRYPFGR
ncbi:MAG: asparaginase [Proteobacteria bacterium]|nr:asparaginase [Pseudomonadota bacterium]MDA1357950.1 asparaginase [Pseudomonadota bacterium]